jgi:hypothetical protein
VELNIGSTSRSGNTRPPSALSVYEGTAIYRPPIGRQLTFSPEVGQDMIGVARDESVGYGTVSLDYGCLLVWVRTSPLVYTAAGCVSVFDLSLRHQHEPSVSAYIFRWLESRIANGLT